MTTKLFVGGLPHNVTDDVLFEHFAKYGEVESGQVKRRWDTGMSRGFGFVRFANAESAEQAAKDGKEHVILGKKVDVKVAVPKEHVNEVQDSITANVDMTNHRSLASHKIFVGGLPPALIMSDFKNHFGQFGAIADAIIIKDKYTKKSKGFGFVTFVLEKDMFDALKTRFHLLKNKMVEVKKATPKIHARDGKIQYSLPSVGQPHIGHAIFSPYCYVYPQYQCFSNYHAPWHNLTSVLGVQYSPTCVRSASQPENKVQQNNCDTATSSSGSKN